MAIQLDSIIRLLTVLFARGVTPIVLSVDPELYMPGTIPTYEANFLNDLNRRMSPNYSII